LTDLLLIFSCSVALSASTPAQQLKKAALKEINNKSWKFCSTLFVYFLMFLCCCCWLLNDEENIRRGKEEAEEPEFQNSFGIRNSSVCVCVRVPCIFGNTSTPLLLLLLLLCRLAK